MNPFEQLLQCGQSIWLDSISRDLINNGELQRLVNEDKLRGVTSNPTIFEQAMAHGESYDFAHAPAVAVEQAIERQGSV